ncbi:MAG: UDP-N-acetylmuramate dehydrogenase [Bacteroidales bacterium]|nr:UDP-N-acetylmuramate dehydrogenase [Bacteroidales bacterium]
MASEQIIAIFTIMIDIQHNHHLKELNSFGLDTRAAHYARPVDVETLTHLLEHENNRQLPLLVLGEGSNILFRNDFDGLIIQPGMKGVELVEEEGDELVVRVGASENWDNLVRYATEQGWYGLENLSLIPGSVGSSPVQNIGAYGVELKERFDWLEAWDIQLNQLVRLDHTACRFGYRSSIFKGEAKGRYIITHVAFRLSRKPDLKLEYGNVKTELTKANGTTPLDLRNVIIAIRRSKLPDPAQYGNAGSFFKNPMVDRTIFNCIRVEYPKVPFYPRAGNQMKIPAAWLIEKSGWKGKRVGNVGTWPTQPLVLVNYGGATGQEIYDFSEKILEDVERLFGVTLEREVNVI